MIDWCFESRICTELTFIDRDRRRKSRSRSAGRMRGIDRDRERDIDRLRRRSRVNLFTSFFMVPYRRFLKQIKISDDLLSIFIR